MRPGGTQTKHGAAVRMRRRLGLAPRAYVLLSCSLVLVIAGVSAYGMTVPSMVQAHAARELHIGRKAKSDLGTTTGYAWASVVGRTVFGVDTADEGEQASNEITLANGKTIVLANTKVITKLSNNSVASIVNKAEQQKEQDTQQAGKPGSSGGSGSGTGSAGSSGGSGSGFASGGGSSSGGSTDGGAGGDAGSGGLSAAEEESIHSWLVTKYNMLDGYVARANSVVSTYNATGDTWAMTCLSSVPSLAGRRFLPSQRGIDNSPTFGVAIQTCANGSDITATITSRLTTSTPMWRRSPYDERPCFYGSPVAQP